MARHGSDSGAPSAPADTDTSTTPATVLKKEDVTTDFEQLVRRNDGEPKASSTSIKNGNDKDPKQAAFAANNDGEIPVDGSGKPLYDPSKVIYEPEELDCVSEHLFSS